MITRGNNTNNYAEAGIRVLKEVIFKRTKAYNLQQVFGFITGAFELYIRGRLLSVALQRNDNRISRKFLGTKAAEIPQDHIKPLSKSSYEVLSSDENKVYWVDLKAGICECGDGKNGYLCKHQSAVIYHYKPEEANIFSVPITPVGRMMYAKVALGSSLEKGPDFFASVRQENVSQSDQLIMEKAAVKEFHSCPATITSDHSISTNFNSHCDDSSSQKIILENLTMVVEDMKVRLASGDPNFVDGLSKFCHRYMTTARKTPLFATSKLASKLHQFGNSGSYIRSRFKAKFPGSCVSGKKIPVQSTGAARRRPGLSRGKGAVKVGRPLGSKIQSKKNSASMNFGRKFMRANVPHNLTQSVCEARLNPS